MTWLWCSLAAAAGLTLAGRALHWLAGRRPGLTAPVRPDFPGWRRPPGNWRVAAVWCLLVLSAAVLPVASGWVAADLDGGLLWFGFVSGLPWLLHGGRGFTGKTLAGAALAGVGVVLPVVLRVSSLNLTDAAVAQQGGAGNWFLIREPFLFLAGLGYLALSAAAWNALRERDGRRDDVWAWMVDVGRPLVSAHLFAVLFLGGWWAFAPFADGLPWFNTLLKTLVALGLILALSRRPWATGALLRGRFPAVMLAVALASLAWLVVSGEVR